MKCKLDIARVAENEDSSQMGWGWVKLKHEHLDSEKKKAVVLRKKAEGLHAHIGYTACTGPLGTQLPGGSRDRAR